MLIIVKRRRTWQEIKSAACEAERLLDWRVADVYSNAPWGCSSAGRVPDWQSGGREFDPRQLHHSF